MAQPSNTASAIRFSGLPLLRATFHFLVRDLRVSRSLLGTSHEFEYRGLRVAVILPAREPQLIISTARDREQQREVDMLFDDADPAPASSGMTIDMRLGPFTDQAFASVSVLRVRVFTTADVSAADFAPSSSDPASPRDEQQEAALGDALEGALERAEETAEAAMRALLAALRVRGRQPWLGLGGETPAKVGTAELVDIDAHERLPISSSGPVIRVLNVSPEVIIQPQELAEIVATCHQEGDLPLAESLLADALFYAWHAEPPDLTRAVLIAAVAAEVRVKQVLRDAVTHDARALLDLLIESPRDFSLAAAALFSKAMEAVSGRSLRTEDRDLHKRIVRLYEVRNDIAHRGIAPEDDEAADCVGAAVDVFWWLRADRG